MIHTLNADVRRASLVLALLVAAWGQAACDPHREERTRVQTLVSQLESQVGHHHQLLEQAQAELARSTLALSQQQSRHLELKAELTRRGARLAEYLTEHKMAALALVATGAGTVTALDDDTRQAIESDLGQEAAGVTIAAGLIGAGFCLLNADECTSVATAMGTYAAERQAAVQQIQQVEASLQDLAALRKVQQQGQDAAAAALQDLQSQLRDAQARTKSLACHGLFCGMH